MFAPKKYCEFCKCYRVCYTLNTVGQRPVIRSCFCAIANTVAQLSEVITYDSLLYNSVFISHSLKFVLYLYSISGLFVLSRSRYSNEAGAKSWPVFILFCRNLQLKMKSDSVLSNSQLKRLAEHKYSCTNSSLLDPFLQPWWNWVVQCLPLWLAPNLITIMGLAVNIVTSLVLIYYNPDGTREVSQRSFARHRPMFGLCRWRAGPPQCHGCAHQIGVW